MYLVVAVPATVLGPGCARVRRHSLCPQEACALVGVQGRSRCTQGAEATPGRGVRGGGVLRKPQEVSSVAGGPGVGGEVEGGMSPEG